MEDIKQKFNNLCRQQWWQGQEGIDLVCDFLHQASMPNNLNALLTNAAANEHLSYLSEKLKSLDKVVLLDDLETKTRLRLHYFAPGDYDLMHNHRWPFASKIIKGKLSQQLFTSIEDSECSFWTNHKTGESYFLSPNFYHKLKATEETVTLILRGPDLLAQASWKNLATDEQWHHKGGKDDPNKIDFQQMELNAVIDKVRNYVNLN